MAVKLASIAVDINAELSGAWIEPPDLPGVRLKVRSVNAPDYQIARGQLMGKLARKYPKGKEIPLDELSSAIGELQAQYLLLDWDGFDVPYSPETAKETLTDPRYRDLVNIVAAACAQVGKAEVQFIEDLAKN